MNPRCDSRDPSNTGIRCGSDVGHMGEHATMMRTRSWSDSPDLMDGGVTAAAIEAEAVSPDRARSLVQENADLRAQLAQQEPAVIEKARPMRAEDLDDEAIRRAQVAWLERAVSDGMPSPGLVRIMFAAALTPPPSRPEGAEGLERIMGEFSEELPEVAVQPFPWDDLADHLVRKGVRVTGAES